MSDAIEWGVSNPLHARTAGGVEMVGSGEAKFAIEGVSHGDDVAETPAAVAPAAGAAAAHPPPDRGPDEAAEHVFPQRLSRLRRPRERSCLVG